MARLHPEVRLKIADGLFQDAPTSEESVKQMREPDSCLLNLVLLTQMVISTPMTQL